MGGVERLMNERFSSLTRAVDTSASYWISSPNATTVHGGIVSHGTRQGSRITRLLQSLQIHSMRNLGETCVRVRIEKKSRDCLGLKAYLVSFSLYVERICCAPTRLLYFYDRLYKQAYFRLYQPMHPISKVQ